ncbi:cytochrome P450 703A2 isoform X1 [Selaginella moellendorffii]|uniref:cytochrome P450 703A2 isoform X1 n=1 Tax=Selaginella moellendorffii TaxID=88036 RepID=UPI000D1CE7C3|nr:cytochrome P450 703A2 isoform X1 [Selaginella moellendorffii]|eukprot:XP_024543891.1 cytochrome P450 703A2 isoform X1 [Selaginella moellendorffii]
MDLAMGFFQDPVLRTDVVLYLPAFGHLHYLVLLGLLLLAYFSALKHNRLRFVSSSSSKDDSCSNKNSNLAGLTLPPGPMPWPIVGNLLQTSPIPHERMLAMNKRYGPLVFLKLGRVPAVVTDDPAIVKAILKNQDAVFASRPASIASQHFTYGGNDIAFAPYGAHWRAMRRICTLELLAPRRLELFKQGREEEIALMARAVWTTSIRKSSDTSHADTTKAINRTDSITENNIVELRHLFGSLASNNLARMLLGKRFFGPGVTGPRDGSEHRSLIYDAFALVNAFNLADYLPFLRWLDVQGYEKKIKDIMNRTDRLYDAVIEEHRSKRTSAEKDGDSTTNKFVDVLLTQKGLSHTVIKAILVDMAAAGTDTTSITSEWTMAELVRHPAVLSKVRDEIERVVGGRHRAVRESDLKHLTYLRAVVKEVLRLHPVGAFLIPHVTVQDTELAGYFIPKNTRALINTYSLGRNPAVWDNPLEFRPERFLGDEESTTRSDREVEAAASSSLFDPEYRMVPFGAGRRGCPGAALGTCMIMYGVSTLVHGFEWATPDGGEIDVSPAYNSVILDKPLKLVPTPRLAEHVYH